MKTDSSILDRQMGNRELPLNASVFIIFLTVLFGANAVAMKVSFTGLGVFSAAGIRFGFAAAAISLWAVCTNRSLRINSRQGVNLFLISVLKFR